MADFDLTRIFGELEKAFAPALGTRLSSSSWSTANIEGLQELERNLNSLSEDVAKKTVRQGVSDGAEIIRRAARENARSAFRVRSGRLLAGFLKSVRVLRSLSVEGGTIRARIGLRVRPRARAAFYGRFLEFGWISRGGRHIPARPFFRPAWDGKREAALQKIMDSLRARIARARLRA